MQVPIISIQSMSYSLSALRELSVVVRWRAKISIGDDRAVYCTFVQLLARFLANVMLSSYVRIVENRTFDCVRLPLVPLFQGIMITHHVAANTAFQDDLRLMYGVNSHCFI